MAIQRFPIRKEEHTDHFLYNFEGLIIKTDRWDREESDRVLVLGRGTAVHVLMNYMYNHPELVRGKYVFEPFAGSGPLGFLAVKLGAKHSDLLDINPRAIQFMRENAARNGFDGSCYSIYEGDVETFQPSQKYDILFANPPFVPLPDGVGMPIHSNGGVDGNRFTHVIVSRLDDFLKPQGEAFLSVFQIEDQHGPIVLHGIKEHITNRHVELTRMRSRSFDFDEVVSEYMADVPNKHQAVITWSKILKDRYGERLCFNYYIIHIEREDSSPSRYTLREYQAESDDEKYGKGFYNIDLQNNLVGTEIRIFLEK